MTRTMAATAAPFFRTWTRCDKKELSEPCALGIAWPCWHMAWGLSTCGWRVLFYWVMTCEHRIVELPLQQIALQIMSQELVRPDFVGRCVCRTPFGVPHPQNISKWFATPKKAAGALARFLPASFSPRGRIEEKSCTAISTLASSLRTQQQHEAGVFPPPSRRSCACPGWMCSTQRWLMCWIFGLANVLYKRTKRNVAQFERTIVC